MAERWYHWQQLRKWLWSYPKTRLLSRYIL